MANYVTDVHFYVARPMYAPCPVRDTAFKLTGAGMQTESLAIIRKTKLDLAQWITSGIGRCRNPAMSVCLARYAAAQLQSAALIPQTETKGHNSAQSLLRRELKQAGNAADSVLVLTRVSRAMLTVLATQGPANSTVAHLIRHEAAASRQIRALCPG